MHTRLRRSIINNPTIVYK